MEKNYTVSPDALYLAGIIQDFAWNADTYNYMDCEKDPEADFNETLTTLLYNPEDIIAYLLEFDGLYEHEAYRIIKEIHWFTASRS